MDPMTPGQGYGGGSYPQSGSGMATASLVCGILATVFAVIVVTWVLGLILGVIAISLGAVARRRGIAGQATAGLVLGIIGTALSVLWLVLVVTYWA